MQIAQITIIEWKIFYKLKFFVDRSGLRTYNRWVIIQYSFFIYIHNRIQMRIEKKNRVELYQVKFITFQWNVQFDWFPVKMTSFRLFDAKSQAMGL